MRRVTVPLTAPTILLVTLISVIGSLLAFDQFYIMTAGQPFNQTATAVFYVYLNSFPYLKLGYGAALSLLIAGVVLLFTVVQLTLTRRSRDEQRLDRRIPGPQPRAQPADPGRVGSTKYLVAADLHRGLHGDGRARSCWGSSPRSRRPARPPPAADVLSRRALSLDSYSRLWEYQAGLPTYLGNSLATALVTIVIALGLTIPAGYALARFPIPARSRCSCSCCWR